MDYLEQRDSIRFLVNTSQTAEEAKDRYKKMVGILLAKSEADSIFKIALNKKFKKTQDIKESIDDLEKKL